MYTHVYARFINSVFVYVTTTTTTNITTSSESIQRLLSKNFENRQSLLQGLFRNEATYRQ